MAKSQAGGLCENAAGPAPVWGLAVWMKVGHQCCGQGISAGLAQSRRRVKSERMRDRMNVIISPAQRECRHGAALVQDGLSVGAKRSASVKEQLSRSINRGLNQRHCRTAELNLSVNVGLAQRQRVAGSAPAEGELGVSAGKSELLPESAGEREPRQSRVVTPECVDSRRGARLVAAAACRAVVSGGSAGGRLTPPPPVTTAPSALVSRATYQRLDELPSLPAVRICIIRLLGDPPRLRYRAQPGCD